MQWFRVVVMMFLPVLYYTHHNTHMTHNTQTYDKTHIVTTTYMRRVVPTPYHHGSRAVPYPMDHAIYRL